MERISISGYLGGDPEVKTNKETGEKFVVFSVGITKGKDENKKTKWYEVVASLSSENLKVKASAEYVANYLKVGDLVFLEGVPNPNAYFKNSKDLVTTIRISMHTVIGLSRSASNNVNSSETQTDDDSAFQHLSNIDKLNQVAVE